MNPAKLEPEHPIRNVEGVQREGFYGSQSWEATSPGEQAEERGPTAPGSDDSRSSADDRGHSRGKPGKA